MRRKYLIYLDVLMICIIAICSGCTKEATDTLSTQQEDSFDSEIESEENNSEDSVAVEMIIDETVGNEEESMETEVAEGESVEETNIVEPSANVQENIEEPARNMVEETETPIYSYAEMSKVMYATGAVNVRTLPSVDGQRIGGLATAQEVIVTGQCNETSWYRVDYNGQVGYVSNKYIAEEKPVIEIPDVVEVPDIIQSTTDQSALVAIDNLANKKSLKKKCTDEEFQAAYDVAAQIVTPLIGLSKEEQLIDIMITIRMWADLGLVVYSTDTQHYNDPYGYFVEGAASCAGCTRATGLCLNLLGISYEHVNENQWGHQWCRVEIDGTYWICDAYGYYVGPEPEPYGHPYVD